MEWQHQRHVSRLRHPSPLSSPPLSLLCSPILFVFCFHPVFDLFPHCGAWSQAREWKNGCYNDHLFPRKYTVKDHISNTKQEKGDHYCIQTWHRDLFSYYNLILRKLSEKMSQKAPENTNEMCSCSLGIL